ncbi:MAG: nuclear transport factor 2 family protein [Anaerolineae bacterium]|nr:nuclear transport factor 2 family protein [Anaerolineae bacterium]
MTVKSNVNQEQVRAVIESWAKAVRDCDMEGILANHTPDILMYDVVAPFQSEGIAAYRKTWELFFKYSPGGEGSFNLTDLKIRAGDTVAFAHATLRVFEEKVRLTVGLIKANDQWLIAHEHHSGLNEQ